MTKGRNEDRFKNLGAGLEALKRSPEPESAPKAKAKARRTTTVHFRANADEHAKLTAAAERLGLTTSAYVRMIVRKELGLT